MLPYNGDMYKQTNNDSQELVQIITDLQEKIEILSKNLNKMVNDFKKHKQSVESELKYIRDQNSVTLETLAENTATMKDCIKTDTPKHTKLFPVSSLHDLEILEESINETNEKEYITSIRAICGQRGVKKGLRELITPEVLDLFNLDGTHGKMRLLNFKKFMHVLFSGSYSENTTDKCFKADIRDALKIAKNRHCKERKKSKENMSESNKDDFIKKECDLIIP